MLLTEKLAEYVLSVSKKNIKPEVWEKAKITFKDCYACMLAGANEKARLIASDYGYMIKSNPLSSIIGIKNFKTDPCTAAMVNGIAAHIHDYDDVSTTIVGHPSVVVLPTVLAVGENMGINGETALIAYITGVEVMALIARGVNPLHYSKGWHSTGTLGIFGAVAAAGKILKINKEQLVFAFGIAASLSSGLKGNFGTMTKSLHAGRAAADGIFAVLMSKLGYDANPNIMEMDGGFAQVTSGNLDREKIDKFIDARDSEFLTPGLSIKAFPSCKATHNGISAAMILKKKHRFNIDNIEQIHIGCQPVAKDLLKYPIAKTPLEGKFSMNYCIACALIFDEVTLEHFEGTVIDNQKILEIMRKVSMEVDEEISKGSYFNGTWETSVTITLKNGDCFSEKVRYAPGDPENPLSTNEHEKKFLDCSSRSIEINKVKFLSEILDHIEDINDINTLFLETANSLKVI